MKVFKQPVSVLVLIYTAEREVLLIERADHPGFWQSVTGSWESSDDSLLHTAAREVEEETGLTMELSKIADWKLSNRYEIYPAWRHRYAPGITHNTEHVMGLCVARSDRIRLNPAEHVAYQWLDVPTAADLCFSASNAEAVLLLPRFL